MKEHGRSKGKLLVAVVADELEERARDILREEGAQGVTILAGRGIGFPEHMTFFGITYRGAESILACVLDGDSAERMAERLNCELELLKPFKGLAFCLAVNRSGGIDLDLVRDAIRRRTPDPGA
ncbi:hypothetical protein [Thioalkalivibrio thiocyanodenitrificans]|uniref:hypothetical protein n=1 Tax=Thioalkalivibrio thiocyanodenitrificans TaxID=243063 RepID=UPI0003649D9C|nr:hypothetical protein [Thioalkalivibrio thiocyanodenitrificans]